MLSLSTVSLYAGESWGAGLFSVKRHDFGRVAIGVDAEYQFVLENHYLEDIKVLSVQSSCGCTSVHVTQKNLKSTEQAAVVAKLNTSGQHTYEKSATITVLLETVVKGQSIQETVQLFVTGYIRPDVVLNPGIVEFGSTAEGHAVTRTVLLEYAGREDWALTKIERTHPFIHARVEQIKNNRGEVVYQITVTLKDNAPVGYVKDALRLTTNERRTGLGEPIGIVLPIHGVVTAPILAKPSPFMAGLVVTGENVAKNIVVRSDTPFRIREVLCEDKRFRFTYAEQQSNIQIISVLFSATGPETDEPIDLVDSIRIRTDLPDQEYVVLEAMARIVPARKIYTQPAMPVKHAPNEENTKEEAGNSPHVVGPTVRVKFGTPKFSSVPVPKTSLVPRQME